MPKYSRTQVNTAGQILKTNAATETISVSEAEDILTYWRYIHAPVINTFQSSLRTRMAKKYNRGGFIAQRLKRVSSIISKLQRYPAMKLAKMQDIAGIRVVMKKIDNVISFYSDLCHSKSPHKLEKINNYIDNPKEDGYRGIHLIFKYVNSKNPDSEGLMIEVQIRTELQHIWATTIESMDTFMGTAMKAGQGDENIRDFFRLVSSAFCLREKRPVCNQHKNMKGIDIMSAMVEKYTELKIFDKLSAFSVVRNEVKMTDRKAGYQLIILDTSIQEVTIKSYPNENIDLANEDYTNLERQHANDNTKQVVLLATDKIANLNRAYPNYFLDTGRFITLMESAKKFVGKEKEKLK